MPDKFNSFRCFQGAPGAKGETGDGGIPGEPVSTLYIYVSLRLRMQNAVSAQPCVGKLGISLVLLNFLDCNFRLWFETP